MEEQSQPQKLQELRAILVGPERELLERLRERIGNPERRTEDLVEVLANAVALGAQRDPRFAEALRAPVGECIKELFRRDMKLFARALFPLILPAIRQAIVEALRSLVQTTNQILDQSLSLKGLNWRWQAWRAGVPFSEVVLRHTLVYRVEQVFLIQRSSGLSMGHVNHPETITKDGDAVAGMLTAIQDFVKDSFQPEEGGQLDTVNLGELTLWIIHGSSAMLACAIRGIPPPELRTRLCEICEEIHLKFNEELGHFDGDDAKLLGLEPHLTECLSFQRKENAGGKTGRPRLLSAPLLILLLLVIGLLVTWQVRRYKISSQTQALRAELTESAGLLVTGIRREEGHWRVEGLRDPLSEDPTQIAGRAGIPPEKIRFELLPVLMLDPEIVLIRAKEQLDPPDTVALYLEDGILRAEGTAPSAWLSKATSLPCLPPGIKHLDLAGAIPDQASLLTLARSVLAPPPEVRLSLSVRALSLAGVAPLPWVRLLGARIPELRKNHIDSVDLEGLAVAEHREAEGLAAKLDQEQIYFSVGTRLTNDGLPTLELMAQRLARLQMLTADLNLELSVEVFGLSDQGGSSKFNTDLRRKRAALLRDALVARGFPAGRISLVSQSPSSADPLRRGAGLHVHMKRFHLQDVLNP